MHEPPPNLRDAEVADALRAHWSVAPVSLVYVPAGFGAYHWLATDADTGRWFATANRIVAEADVPDLLAAMTAAAGLADRGLDFIVAPVLTSAGLAAVRLGQQYVLTLFPFVGGSPGRWGDTLTAADRAAVTRMLAALHQARPGPEAVPVRTTDVPGRARLEFSPRERARPWRGGPYAVAVWELMSDHAGSLQAALTVFDNLAGQVAAEARPAVVTHGEPHPGNLIRQRGHYLLIDWDTMGLAAPERDLWWVLSDTGAEADLYARLTGRTVSRAAVALYRLRWDLVDISLLLAELPSAQRADEDTETGWAALKAAVERIADIARAVSD